MIFTIIKLQLRIRSTSAQVSVYFPKVLLQLFMLVVVVWICTGVCVSLVIHTKISVKPVLNWANVCSPNILRTLPRTMIRFLIELLVRRIWFGLYFILNWLVMRCKLQPELAADTQQTA